jgi:hypothetical protein
VKRLCVVLSLILLVSGCTLGCGTAQYKADAENVVANYFKEIGNKNFDTAITFYSPKFFEETSGEDWLQTLESINIKLGDLETYKLTFFKVRTVTGFQDSGTYCDFQYEVTYSKYPATENLTLYEPTDGGGFKISRHTISSVGFIKE